MITMLQMPLDENNIDKTLENDFKRSYFFPCW